MNPTLKQKIDATNKLRTFINDNAQRFIDAVKPFVGKKIRNANGEWSKAFNAAIDSAVTRQPGFQFYVPAGDYRMDLRVSMSASLGEFGCFYLEDWMSLGRHDHPSRQWNDKVRVMTEAAEYRPRTLIPLSYAEDSIKQIQKLKAQIAALETGDYYVWKEYI